jgi:cardiolipin synthase A/B
VLIPGNRLTLLENGAQYFRALLEAMETARQEIHLESYIFELDDTGNMVLGVLRRAAARGVRVRLLLDGFGCRHFPGPLARDLRLAGIQLLFYRPEVEALKFRRHRLRRMHRKLALVDAQVAFVGGINVIDDHNAPGRPSHRFDYAVRVEGPVVAEIWQAMRRLWWQVRWSRIGRRPRPGPGPQPVRTLVGAQRVAFLPRDNLRHRRDIEDAYLEAIQGARQEVLIANAYFLPGWRFRRALVEAAQRGVRVALLMQGRTDHHLYLLAAQALYQYFLNNGIEIHEYRASYMHAKVAVVDEDWATVGSSNIDPFSLFLSREANLVIRDCHFAGELRTSLHRAMHEQSRPIRPRDWQRVPLYQRAASWAVYGLVRLAVGWLGYARPE